MNELFYSGFLYGMPLTVFAVKCAQNGYYNVYLAQGSHDSQLIQS